MGAQKTSDWSLKGIPTAVFFMALSRTNMPNQHEHTVVLQQGERFSGRTLFRGRKGFKVARSEQNTKVRVSSQVRIFHDFGQTTVDPSTLST